MVPEQLPVRLERKPFLPPPKVVRFICVHFVSNWTKSPPTYARAEDSYLDWLGRLVPLRDREMWLMIEVYRAALSLSVTERCGSWSKFTGPPCPSPWQRDVARDRNLLDVSSGDGRIISSEDSSDDPQSFEFYRNRGWAAAPNSDSDVTIDLMAAVVNLMPDLNLDVFCPRQSCCSCS